MLPHITLSTSYLPFLLTEGCWVDVQIVQISSTMGSIGSLEKILRGDSGKHSKVGSYALPYRCSKAALNMGARLS